MNFKRIMTTVGIYSSLFHAHHVHSIFYVCGEHLVYGVIHFFTIYYLQIFLLIPLHAQFFFFFLCISDSYSIIYCHFISYWDSRSSFHVQICYTSCTYAGSGTGKVATWWGIVLIAYMPRIQWCRLRCWHPMWHFRWLHKAASKWRDCWLSLCEGTGRPCVCHVS